MGGGLLQLVALGQADEYLTINPDISFYKYVYKKYSNFSMESIQLTFDFNPVLSPSSLSSGYTCKIQRYGDLLKDIYFCYTLPEIYSSDKYRFKWVKNVGSLFIKRAYITISGVQIDVITGEFLNIRNELVNGTKQKSYNKIIGNYDYIINPKLNQPRLSIKNNKFYTIFYPESSKETNIPSIPSVKLSIPLSFWFTKIHSMALPLLKMQYSEVFLTIEPEISENLYQVYSKDLDMYISPQYYNELYNDNINIFTFIKSNEITPYLEANYIFINTYERNIMINTPSTSYLIEQLYINNNTNIITNASINLYVNKPVKEIIWTLRRDDYNKYNDNDNYTASIPEDFKKNILNTASIIWNKTNNRIEEKNNEYFNIIQPYQHHESIPRQGIYCYSFSLNPDKEINQPSGHYNAATVSTTLNINLNTNYNNKDINDKLIKINKNPYNFNYIANVYVVQYNIFEIIGGNANLKFS